MVSERMRRMVAVGVTAGAALVALAGCVRTTAVTCPDGTVCPDTATCLAASENALGEPVYACATPTQFEACAGDGAACTNERGECVRGACFPAVCGDGLWAQSFEVCDDGNRVSGDGCSSDCLSTEVCNDGVVNAGEQCDDGGSGVAGLSGDGCTSSCIAEFTIWRDLDPGEPPLREGAAVATAPGGGTLIFGGAIAGSSAGPTTAVTATFEDLWRWDGKSWSLIALPFQPPRRAYASMAYDAARGHVVIFGGYGPTRQPSNDMFIWDGLTMARIDAAPIWPPNRAEAGLACDGGRCVLYGGSTGAIAPLTDTWEWNGATWRRIATTPYAMPPPVPPTVPGPLARPVLTFDSTRNVYMMYGGSQSSLVHVNELWETPAPVGQEWDWVRTVPQALRPPALPAVGAFHPPADRLIVSIAIPASPDTSWEFDASNSKWTQIVPAPPMFDVGFLGAAYDPGLDVVVYPRPGFTVPAAYQLSSSLVWTSAPARFAQVRTTSAAAYDARRGQVLVSTQSATWAWDRDNWRYLLDHPVPPPAGGTMVYDDRCDRALRFGQGWNATVPTSETSLLERSQPAPTWQPWTGPSPDARVSHAMAYDAARGVVVLYGGRSSDSALAPAEIWEWGGACSTPSWTKIENTGQPGAREFASLTYDERRRKVVLFGGSNGTVDLGDTWEWDGVSWSQQFPGAAPPARSRHVAGYDPRRQRVVLFSGSTVETLYDDLWEWDGDAIEWRRLGPVVVPKPRVWSLMTRDLTGGVIMLGGLTATAPIDRQVSRFRSEQTIHPTETCRDGSKDLDGDGLAGCADPDCLARCAPLCTFGACDPSLPRCGDGVCSPVEDRLICAADCM